MAAKAGRPSQCQSHRKSIESKLEAGLSAQRIYQDLVSEVGFGGSYQSVKRFVRQLRKSQPERVWRIEVQPGEEVQIDFGAGAPVMFPVFPEGQRTVHRDSHVEVDKAYYAVAPEYIGQCVWARWDGREVRIFNQRWEQIALHARLSPGQFSQTLGLGGGNGSLQRQVNYWLKRAQELGGPCGLWAQGMLERKGPLGLRSLVGLVGLADQHSFQNINDACASALSPGRKEK